MSQSKQHIVVIGAGVTGLQSAISLLETGQYDVTIVAKHFPGDQSIDYTSPWAGAQWRTHASEDDEEQKAWDVLSYKKWWETVKSEKRREGPTSGLGIYDSVFYSEDPAPPWFAKDVNEFQMLSGTQNIGGKALTAHKYKSIMINVPMYLEYLLARATTLGAITLRTVIPTSSSLAGTLRWTAEAVKYSENGRKTPITAFVNATGIGARTLVPDENIFPVRGQTITVRGEAKGITTVDASPDNPTPESPNITYILPRPHSGTTILGGTKQVGNWSGQVNQQTTKEILNRAKEFAPELLNSKGEFDVISAQVGLRPGRKGGARVEIEEVRLPGQVTGDAIVVCHAYGHAGAGYQNSLGSAEKVVRLVDEHLKRAPKAKL